MRFVFLAISLLFLAHATLAQQDCTASDADECFKKIRQGKACVYEAGACKVDSCIYKDLTTCSQQSMCLATAWMDVPCNHRFSLCSLVGNAADCNNNPLCSWSGANCVYSVPTSYETALPKPSECPGFPVWSVALVVVWVFMIIILVVLILLVLKKPARGHLEQSNISVEGVGNKDNFTTDLDEPFR